MKLSTQWLPEIPTSWQIANPRTLFSERTQKSTVSDIHLTPSQKFGVLPQSEYMEMTGGRVVLNLTGSDNMKHVEKNDFIIHLRSFQGGIEHSNYSGKVSNAYCVLKPTQQIEPRYFRWVLKSQGYIQELNATTDQLRDGQSIKFEQFASIGLPLPPIEEQRRIADYLDSQLHSVRMMISKKEALSDSLSQERLTKISSLVTSGSCDTRDSFGSDIDDWTQFKSKEWKLLPLKHLVSLDNSGVWGEDPGVLDIDVPVATTAHLTRTNRILFEQMPIRSLTLKDFRKYVCASGDLIVVKSSGSSDNIMSGKVCVVGDDATKFAFSNFLMRLRPHDASLSRFLQAFLSSHVGVERVKRMVSVTTYPNLRVEEYMNSLIPVPPENEIRQLNETIKCIEIKYSTIIEKIQQSLENLRQYESALISELVTGSKSVPNKREEVNA